MSQAAAQRTASGGLPRWVSSGLFVAVIAIAYPFIRAAPYDLSIGLDVGVFAIAAIGVSMAVGGAGQMALGQAGFMAIGAYSVAYLTARSGLPFLLALVVGLVLATCAGILIGYIALRLEGHYLAMATLAAGGIVYTLLLSSTTLGGSQGFFGIPTASLAGYTFTSPRSQYLLMWSGVAIAFALSAWVKRSYIGHELRAIRDDEVAARCIGINITRRKVQIFAFSALLGGLAGGLNAALLTAIDPALFSPGVSFQLFVIAVLGGLGSLAGAVGASALVVLLAQVVPGGGDNSITVLGVIAILVMATLPAGLAALAPKREWFDRFGPRGGSANGGGGSGGDGNPIGPAHDTAPLPGGDAVIGSPAPQRVPSRSDADERI
jgi:branched-chain amino acid transport system permease protein